MGAEERDIVGVVLARAKSAVRRAWAGEEGDEPPVLVYASKYIAQSTFPEQILCTGPVQKLPQY